MRTGDRTAANAAHPLLGRLPGFVVVIAAGLLATASTTEPATPDGSSCGPNRPGSATVTLTTDGLARSSVVHVPPSSARRRLPLVLALHGAGGSGAWMEASSGLSRLADRMGFIVAYPSATGTPARWNIAGASGQAPDDVAFVHDLLAALESRTCVDSTRVFATGVSNGGGMVARLGCELSDRLRAIAPVAGGYSTLPACRPVRPVSVLEIHGTSDHVVPYAGRGRGHAGDVLRFVRGWAKRDRCPRNAARSAPARTVRRLVWAPCEQGRVVEHLRVIGGEHEWPDIEHERGRRSVLSASAAVVRFFAGGR
jgi:polyhydroxybutyrate depolymerase